MNTININYYICIRVFGRGWWEKVNCHLTCPSWCPHVGGNRDNVLLEFCPCGGKPHLFLWIKKIQFITMPHHHPAHHLKSVLDWRLLYSLENAAALAMNISSAFSSVTWVVEKGNSLPYNSPSIPEGASPAPEKEGKSPSGWYPKV